MNFKNSTKKPVSGLAFFLSAICIVWIAWPDHIGAIPEFHTDFITEVKGRQSLSREFPQKSYFQNPKPRRPNPPYAQRPMTEPRFSQPPALVIDINEADSIDWVQIPGIGPKTAKRIVASRIKMHGFYSAQQLLEVYYFDSNLLHSNRVQFRVKPQSWKGLNWDSLQSKQDLFHPYLSASQRNSLWAYKCQHPDFHPKHSPRPLCIDSHTWNKLKPYWL